MQYPNTPSSGYSALSPRTPPSAPHANPRNLPPSPYTPASSSAYGSPPAAPRMHTVGLPDAHSHHVSYGLMTPPSSPAKGPSAGGPTLHRILTDAAYLMSFPITHPPQHVRFAAGCSPTVLAEPAVQPPVPRLSLSILGVFLVDVQNRHGVTVGDVLAQVHAQMARAPLSTEVQRFPSEVTGPILAAGRPTAPRRTELLGPRVLFSSLRIVRLDAHAVHCELHLAA